MSTPPAEAQESLGLIFSQNRKSAEYPLGESAAGGLLIQLCLCKLVAEETMRVGEEAGGAESTYTLANALMSGAFGGEVVSQELLLRREVVQMMWRLQGAWEQLDPRRQSICQSAPWKIWPRVPGPFPPCCQGASTRTRAHSDGTAVKHGSSSDLAVLLRRAGESHL